MKTKLRLLIIVSFLAVLPYLSQAQTESPGAKDDISAQNNDPSRDGPGGGDQPPGGGAPIGGGLFILLGLGAAYGGKKLYHLK